MPHERMNLVGVRYGRLTIIADAPPIRRKHDGRSVRMCLCRCDCGTERIVRLEGLRSGGTKSCGCFNSERRKTAPLRHGHCRKGRETRTHYSWANMIRRCTEVENERYPDYGGRGITVCERWLGQDGFVNFLADMGECPPRLTLDRIENDGNYEPDNCRWTTRKEQSNNRRSNVVIWSKGKRLTMKQFAQSKGIDYKRFAYLYRTKNLPIQEALQRCE